MALIVVPQLLTTVLRNLDADLAAEIALRFAHRVVVNLAGQQLELVESYIAMARTVYEGSPIDDEFKSTRSRLFSDLRAASGFDRDALNLAVVAVNCAIQPQIEAAGVQVPRKYRPKVETVAAKAQHAIRALTVERGDDDPAAAAYEEARTQLMDVIALLPNPGHRPTAQ